MSNPNLLDPSTWFPKPATTPAATSPAPAPVIPDLLGKLDSLLSEQQNTNALLTALLDQMATQQQVQQQAPAQRVTVNLGNTVGQNLIKSPFVWYDYEAKQWYKVKNYSAGTATLRVPAASIFTVSGSNLIIEPIALTKVMIWGDPTCITTTAPGGVLTLAWIVNGAALLGGSIAPVLPAFGGYPYIGIAPGLQEFDLIAGGYPVVVSLGGTLITQQFILQNVDAGSAHVAHIIFIQSTLIPIMDPTPYLGGI